MFKKFVTTVGIGIGIVAFLAAGSWADNATGLSDEDKLLLMVHSTLE